MVRRALDDEVLRGCEPIDEQDNREGEAAVRASKSTPKKAAQKKAAAPKRLDRCVPPPVGAGGKGDE